VPQGVYRSFCENYARSHCAAGVSDSVQLNRATSVHLRATSVAATPYNPRALHAVARTPFGALTDAAREMASALPPCAFWSERAPTRCQLAQQSLPLRAAISQRKELARKCPLELAVAETCPANGEAAAGRCASRAARRSFARLCVQLRA
jgi:hypothetical protein